MTLDEFKEEISRALSELDNKPHRCWTDLLKIAEAEGWDEAAKNCQDMLALCQEMSTTPGSLATLIKVAKIRGRRTKRAEILRLRQEIHQLRDSLDWADWREDQMREELAALKGKEISCVQCGKPVEKERHCYALPTCYACLPPPPPLPIVSFTKKP